MARRTRRYTPPPKGVSGFAVTLWIIAGLFAFVVGWILFAPESLAPEEWWARNVRPTLQRKAEAEARSDWPAALAALEEALAALAPRRDEFRGREAGLRAEVGTLRSRIRREETAGRRLEELRRLVAEAEGAPEPWTRKHALMIKAGEAKRACAGTRHEKALARLRDRVRDLPAPPPGWLVIRREAGMLVDEGEFSRALALLSGFAPRASAEERESLETFRVRLEARAEERFRRDAREGGSLRAALPRYAGTRMERVIRERLEGEAGDN